MNLTCGIIGKPYCGKSTLFALMTGEHGSDPYGITKGMARVRDPRIEKLSAIYSPKKTTFANIQYIDVPGIQESQGRKGETKVLENIRNAHSILAVIAAFDNTDPDIDSAVKDINDMRDELLLNDLILVENRLEKVKYQRTPQEKADAVLFEKLRSQLEENMPLRSAGLTDDEIRAIRGYQFYTIKPIVFAVNLNEDAIPSTEKVTAALKERAGLEPGSDLICLSVKIEEEIAMLPEEDRAVFLEDLGISESATDKVIRTTYDLLGLISFFTAGEDEVKAWTIHDGTIAKNAAGEIHSDIERGFIKAELAGYDDFMKFGGDMKKVREAGLLRLEGKEYVVRDGDIINFKFNV